jgi:hypothetical protein
VDALEAWEEKQCQQEDHVLDVTAKERSGVLHVTALAKKPVVNTRCGECAAREMKEAPTYSQRPGPRFQSLIIVPVDSFVRNSRTASVVALVAASSIRRRLNTLAVQ